MYIKTYSRYIGALLVFVSVLITSCQSGSNEVLFQKMAQQIQPVRTMTHGYRVLNLDSIADFEWDSVYFFRGPLFSPYISKVIGFEWNGEPLALHNTRLLFVSGKKVTSYTDFSFSALVYPDKPPMPLEMFICTEQQEHGLSRAQAKFAIFRECSEITTYTMLPMHCLNNLNFQKLIKQGCTENTLLLLSKPHNFDSLGILTPIDTMRPIKYRDLTR